MPFDDAGYTPETLEDIISIMSADAVSVNPTLDPSSNALMGILVGLVSKQVEQQSQNLSEIYSSLDPDTAEKKALDVLAWKSGLIRKTDESDTALRIRVKVMHAAGGNCTVAAIYAQVSNIQGTTDVNIAENDNDIPEPREGQNTLPAFANRPPHCFEVCVEGGDSLEIARAIRLTKAGGIQAYGENIIASESEFGSIRPIGVTRATVIPTHLRLTYNIYDEEVFPFDGEDQIAEALIVFAKAEYLLGKDIIAQRIVGIVHGTVRGVHSVSVEVSFDGSLFTEGNVAMAAFEKPSILKENITFIAD